MKQTETDTFEKALAQSIDGMYRAAYLVLGSADRAADTVKAVCTICVRRCGGITDPETIRRALLTELARRCLFLLHDCTPIAHDLPESLRTLTHEELLSRILTLLERQWSRKDEQSI